MTKFRLLAGTLLLTPAAASAQTADLVAPAPDAAAAPAADEQRIAAEVVGDAIVVTAGRAPQPIGRVAASVAVLDKADIDRAGDLSVADLLVRTPGVSLSRTGGYGTATSLRIRGAEGDQTVVVIDGVKLNDPSSVGGGYNFANLLVNDASRIEVLRGPQSTLWGSQAIGGVVNVVTPLPGETLEGSFDVEAGSRDTVSGRAAVGGRVGPLSVRVGAQSFTTDGISALAPEAGGVERDGYRNRSANGRALLQVTDGLSAELRAYYTDARVEIDGFGVDSDAFSLTEEFVGYAGVNLDLFGGRLRNRVGYGITDVDRADYDPARVQSQTFDAIGRNYRVEYQGSLAVTADIEAVFGAENEVSRFRTASAGFGAAAPLDPAARARAEITSGYGQLSVRPLDGLTLTGGVRHDDHSRFGSQTLFSAGGVWALPWGTTVRASYGEGFKAPTLYQLFSEYGNEALDPERATGWEAGVEKRFLDGRAIVGATYFERRSRDQINFASCLFPADGIDPLCVLPGTTVPRFGYYFNVDRAFAQGIEAAGRLALAERLTVDGNYSWTTSENRSAGSATFGQQLARRPRHAWNLGATYAVPDVLTVGAAVRWSGEAFEYPFGGGATRLDPYTLVDLRMEVPLSPSVAVFARAENLLDEAYRTAVGFSTLGRSIYAGLRGRF